MEPGASEADEGGEGVYGLAVACGETPELFEAVEAAFYAVAQFV